eukprot:CAMPEP_0170332288 /NCGR_PEP_ID=MMETSP0116_2-20130129/67138_1 /TAXON_ID=400756 /ORGANISM="Durinskia baltica, Strain CSIRO CS-38" /LENGTH=94 /DNA_ID=CAMNT_0010585579 /DNA_START=83 /DNA_END=365 /DNA_ORIENTATION=-
MVIIQKLHSEQQAPNEQMFAVMHFQQLRLATQGALEVHERDNQDLSVATKLGGDPFKCASKRGVEVVRVDIEGAESFRRTRQSRPAATTSRAMA